MTRNLLAMAALACLLSGCQREAVQPPPTPPSPVPAPETTVVKVYFADPETALLRAVERTVSADMPDVQALMALWEGPREGEGLDSAIPEGVSSVDLQVENGLATLDLSKEFREGFPQGAFGNLAIYAIVNTLTEFPEVEAVDILIEGQAVETLGEISLAEPLTRNEDLIAPEGP